MRFRVAGSTKGIGQNSAALVADPSLSFRAKGLLAYFSTLPEGTALDIKALVAAATEGKQAILTALLELERAGYCEPIADASVIKQDTSASPDPVDLPLFEEQAASSRDINKKRPLGTKAREDQRIQHVIGRLNELRRSAWDWKNFTPLSSRHAKNIEHIRGRLNEGYSETDLILVLEHLATVDGGKEESRKYFDCVTPFNTKNFERNLAMARDWAARGRTLTTSREQLNLEQSHDPSIYDRGRRGG